MTQALQYIPQPKEERAKKLLQKAILKKRKILADWATKVEMLQMDLDFAKHQYDVRIGRLLLKDNQLDLEIIQSKNLKKLIDEGMTYAQAVAHEESKFYSEILKMQKEQDTIDAEIEELHERKEVSSDIQQEIKSVWKSLIRKFHPDLVLDEKEKEEREVIMKKINTAYAVNDLDGLKVYEDTVHMRDFPTTSMEALEQILVNAENMIITLKNTYKQLKSSQWFAWKTRLDKAQKTNEDIFKDLEKSLLDDIVKKIDILKNLTASFAIL